jgi:protein TonB
MTARVIRDDDDPRELYRWALAGLIMLTAHLALVATFMLLRKPDALPAGAPVVLVDLAPAPSAPTEQPLDLPPVVENVPTPPQPVEQEVQPTPPEPEALPTPPEPQVAALPEPVPEPPPPVPAAEVVLPTPPEKPVEEKVEPPKPREVPKREAKKERPKQKQPPPRTAAGAPTRSTAPASPQTGVTARSNATDSDWRSRLIAQLQRSKRYPAGAQSRGETGTAVLSFTMDRNGRVLARSIARSSGVAELDAEVMALVMRAQPLPPFPPSMTQPRMTLSVPIRFSVR